MGKQIRYNAELMDDIASKYKEGYDKLGDAITSFKSFKNTFKIYYEGQANVEIFGTISKTLLDHLELLQLCYSNMGEYVTLAKEDMLAADASLSNAMTGSSQKNGGGE